MFTPDCEFEPSIKSILNWTCHDSRPDKVKELVAKEELVASTHEVPIITTENQKSTLLQAHSLTRNNAQVKLANKI